MNNPLSKILDWLRVGYPDGVPPKDFYPLLALLTHNLSEEELSQIIEDIKRENPEGDLTEADVHGAIERVTSAPATEDHAREVAERLADAGWPIDEESVEVARAVAKGGDLESTRRTPLSEQVTPADPPEDGSAEAGQSPAPAADESAGAASRPESAPEPTLPSGTAPERPESSAEEGPYASAHWTAVDESRADPATPPATSTPSSAPAAPDEADASPGARTHASSAPYPGGEVSSSSVQRILDWLSAGYPAGIPATDRLPLLALLRRQLTDDEAQEIASHLVDEAGHRIVDPTDAGVAITRYTNDLPTEKEMRRVAEHLAERGWPLGERR